MKAVSFFVLAICLTVKFLYSQAPGILWQNTLQGSKSDLPYSVVNAADGAYFISGISNSESSPDKSENNKGEFDYYDYWVVKMSNSGYVLWENTIGGKRDETNSVVCSTPDGGCIVGGTSQSTATGDKTETSIGGEGDVDFWVLKLDASGNISWQNTIGGTGSDQMRNILATEDGGFLLIGESNSNSGFDKSENGFGGYDFWVVKIDAMGTVVWNKTYGGNLDDLPLSIFQTTDDNYIIAGSSTSGVSGNKTTPNKGNSDFWVIKIDNVGNVLWQRSYGTSKLDHFSDAEQTIDGGIILVGYTNAGITGDKTVATFGMNDYWVIKANAIGDIQWQLGAGGNKDDWADAVSISNSGNIYIGGSSMSGVSGNKTVASLGGTFDSWILKLDASGNIVWQKDIQGNDSDYFGDMVVNDENELVAAVYSFSSNSNDKFEPWYGLYDYWIFKLSDTCNAEFCNSMDDDCDGLIDDATMDTVYIAANEGTSCCAGGNVKLQAYHSSGTIQWLRNGNPIPGATGDIYFATKKGNYSCKLNIACELVTSNIIEVKVYKYPVGNIVADGPTTFCDGDSVVLSCTNLPEEDYTYQWYNGMAFIPGALGSTLTVFEPGTYKCLVIRNVGGCGDFSNIIDVHVTCKTSSELSELQIAPNPSNGKFTCSVDPEFGQIQQCKIVDVAGQVVYNVLLNGGADFTIDTSLPTGIYQVLIFNDYGEMQSKPLVIE